MGQQITGNKIHRDLWENPMGTDGFEFVEFAAPEPEQLATLFTQLGFTAIARHRHKNVTLFRQGAINFILNAEPGSFGERFATAHGPSACATAFRVRDADLAWRRAVDLGATPVAPGCGPMELNIPAIEGIGGALIYLVDRYGDSDIYDVDFRPLPDVDPHPSGVGLTYIDHLTHNVFQGRMDQWAGYYEKLFNFRELRYFDIEGKLTGLHSRAMTSPCGQIRIPINEEASDGAKGQIQEYLDRYHGEGIQHIALGTDDIYAAVEALRARRLRFLDTPDTYYEMVDKRVPGHGETLARLRDDRILVDGDPAHGQGVLLQIFTDTVVGPIFFEIIQRKGNDGFGEGNFKALFDSIELDQIRRGVIDAAPKH